MKVTYKCDKCQTEKKITVKPGNIEETIPCDCGDTMNRQWNATASVPDYFGEHEYNTIRSKMETTRPSGRDKVIF